MKKDTLKITLKIGVSPLQKRIFDFAINSHLKGPETYDEIKKEAEKFLSENDGLKIEDLKPISFLDLDSDLYPLIKEEWSPDFSNKIFVIDYLVQVMMNILNKYEPIDIKYTHAVRQASPPPEVYEYIGHSELNIGPFLKIKKF